MLNETNLMSYIQDLLSFSATVLLHVKKLTFASSASKLNPEIPAVESNIKFNSSPGLSLYSCWSVNHMFM